SCTRTAVVGLLPDHRRVLVRRTRETGLPHRSCSAVWSPREGWAARVAEASTPGSREPRVECVNRHRAGLADDEVGADGRTGRGADGTGQGGPAGGTAAGGRIHHGPYGTGAGLRQGFLCGPGPGRTRSGPGGVPRPGAGDGA